MASLRRGAVPLLGVQQSQRVRVGVERNARYDFTQLDNTIYTIGLERALGRPE